MRKRGIIGTLLLLVYLAGVGLFTGPSENGVESAQDGDVAYTTEVAVG